MNTTTNTKRKRLQAKTKIQELFIRYKWYIILGLLFAVSCIVVAMIIFSKDEVALEKLAETLMTFGETILGAGLIVGGINWLLENFRKAERDAESERKEYQESKEKAKLLLRDMQNELEDDYDDIALARILIKSHQSGRTYGEQIRNRIMPKLVSLQDFKRELIHIDEDKMLTKANIHYLTVSVSHMIAYLISLVQEFEDNYLSISNLQTYQDELANQMRTQFAEMAIDKGSKLELSKFGEEFVKDHETLFKKHKNFDLHNVVWEKLQELKCLKDFITVTDGPVEEGTSYERIFVLHYMHCNKILKTGKPENSLIKSDELFSRGKAKEAFEKEKEDPEGIKNQQNLVNQIMEEKLGDFMPPSPPSESHK